MPSLHTWELNSIREDIENDLLPDYCNILTATYAADNQGGFTPTWGTLSTNIKCRFDTIKPREQIVSDRNSHFSQFIVSVAATAVVNPTYRIEYGGAAYNVIGVVPQKSWNAVKRITVEAVKND